MKIPFLARCFFIFCVLILNNSPVAQAEVREVINYQYYDFKPQGYRDFRDAALAASRIYNEAGTIRYLAETYWQMRWHAERKVIEGKCQIIEYSVTPRIRIKLPRMQGGTEAQQRAFEKYLEKLKAHELKHVAIVLKYAKSIDQKIAKIPPAQNCDDLSRKIAALVEKEDNKAEAESMAYDKKTRHGATEGL